MVWNTILIWLISMGILAGITILALLGLGDTLALVIVPIALSVFFLPITSAVCGFRAAKGHADMTAAILIAGGMGLLLLYGVTEGFRLWTGTAFLCLVPVLATGLSYGLGRLLVAAKPFSPVLYGGAVAATVLISAVSLYLLGALQSQMAYLSLPKELFYHRPKNSVTALHGKDDPAGNHLLFSDESQTPFNGTIVSYRERLTLNFFTNKKASGIGCYIDGFSFGNSGDVVLPGYYNRWYGTNEYFSEWLYNEQAPVGQPYPLHRDYPKTLEREFPAGSAVYYMEKPDLRQNYSTSPLPMGVAIYSEGNALIRKEITYHQNGVVDWISVYTNSGLGWENGYSIGFDALGYSRYPVQMTKWSESDFLPTDFDSIEAVRKTFDGSRSISRNPERMVYVPYPENWEDGGNLVDNLIAVYGLPLTDVSVSIGGKHRELTHVENDEGNDFLSLMGRSTPTLLFLETDDEVDAFQYDAVRFLITSNDTGDSLRLYFMDGRILVEDGPYYLDVLATPENDSEDDAALRKNLYERLLDTIEKYMREQPLGEDELGEDG